MSTIEQAIRRLRQHSEPVPAPAALPTKAQIAAIEQTLGFSFPTEYRVFLLTGSDVVLGTIEPATITAPESHTYLPKVIKSARDFGVPKDLLPFCEDNSDFYCLEASGAVVFWSHDCSSDENWPSLADWIEREWIDGHS